MKKTGLVSKQNGLKLVVIFSACLLMAGIVYSKRSGRTGFNRNLADSGGKNMPLNDSEKARKAFIDAATVFFSPRCANCHPGGDFPTQGDAMDQHFLDVVRGDDGKGGDGMNCTACHQEENAEGEGMPPGAPNWHMPPAVQKMPFQGVTAGDLCRQLKDPEKNGGRKTVEESLEHLKGDPLVLWAWSPGNDRTTPPLSHADFLKKMNEWAENGAGCPE